jgi:ribose 5-phosphate isomerase
MAVIKYVSKTISGGSYLVVTDSGTFVVKGDPQSASDQIQAIAGIVANFMLQETDDFLLLESDDKIIL